MPGRGGVSFAGDRALLYRANLWLRTAVRVLMPILQTEVGDPDTLYAAVRSVNWERHLTPDHTLAVDANVRDSEITHSHYAALRVKDAICDWFVERAGRRPSVDVENPLVKINLHLSRNRLVLSLDSSGASLHKRGYRPVQVKAPLNEALAAGLLVLSGWTPGQPLVDPMCGSGTFCIEAAWQALGRAPGLTRRRFGFMGWPDFDIRLWTHLRDQARTVMGKSLAAPILGSDLRGDAVQWSQTNAREAGVGHLLPFIQMDARNRLPPPDVAPGWLVCNPPYGERISEVQATRQLQRELGAHLRAHWQGWRAWFFTPAQHLATDLGLTPMAKIPLWNGRIPCHWWGFEIG